MMKINYEDISLKDWDFLTHGSQAEVYTNKKNNKVILKLAFDAKMPLEKIKEEAEISQKAIELGIHIPKIYKFVKVNNRYGIIYEKLNVENTVGKLCTKNPENIEYYAKVFAKEVYNLHQIKVKKKEWISKKNQLIKQVNITKNNRYKQKIFSYINDLKETNHIIHGDLTVENIVIGNKNNYFLDVGTLQIGDAAYELGVFKIITTFFVRYKSVQENIKMGIKLARNFYEAFYNEYITLSNFSEKDLIDFNNRIVKTEIITLYFLVVSSLKQFNNNPILINKMKELTKEIMN